jgi:hypothetical protein
MAERTEEDKLVQSPVKVILGGKEYLIKPLPIKYSLPWVKKVIPLIADAIGMSNITSDDAQAFAGALNEVMISRPEQLCELFFEYARELDKAEIEEVASSREIVTAFEEVLAFERPLFGMTYRVFIKALNTADLENFLSSSLPSGMSPQTKS